MFTWKKNKLSAVGQILGRGQSTFHSQEILQLYEVLMQRRGRSVVPLLRVQLDRYLQHVVLHAWALPPIAALSISCLEWGSPRQLGIQLTLLRPTWWGMKWFLLPPSTPLLLAIPSPKVTDKTKTENRTIFSYCIFACFIYTSTRRSQHHQERQQADCFIPLIV